jgi:hypothetical protein
MKRLITVLLFFAGTAAFAQDAQDELALIKSLFGTDKDLIVEQFVRTEGASKAKFWNLYKEFENVRKELGQKKFSLLNSYVKKYSSLPEPELDKIMIEIISLNAEQDKLIAKYYKKVKAQCGISVAAQFYQIEWYLLSEIRTAILENIPVIGELENRK